MTVRKEHNMQKTTENSTIYDFEAIYIISREYEALISKPDKTKPDLERIDELYGVLLKEAPYFLDFIE